MSFLCREGHLVREQEQISNCPDVPRRRSAIPVAEAAPPGGVQSVSSRGRYAGRATFYCDADSRLGRVKTMNRVQLTHAQGAKGLQKAVRVAIERRLKKMAEGK